MASRVSTGELRGVLVAEALSRLVLAVEGAPREVLEDSFMSVMALGPPGIGKSTVPWLAARDVAGLLSKVYGSPVEAVRVSLRSGVDEASVDAACVAAGACLPYAHLYVPQLKIWSLEGTPSPQDHFVEVAGARVPVNLWRVDPYMLPFLDHVVSHAWTEKRRPITPFLIIDEFNMGRREVREALFQLARGAEIGRAKLSPLTVISLLGNTPETNVYAERELPEPLLNRAMLYDVERPSVDAWLAYMREVYGDRFDEAVAGFLVASPDRIYVRVEGGPPVTPRSWSALALRLHALSRLRSTRLGRAAGAAAGVERHEERVIRSLLHGDVADEFVGFLSAVRALGGVDPLSSPETLARVSREAAAFLLVKASGRVVEVYRRDRARGERMLARLAEAAASAQRTLGAEAVGLVVSSLPAPLAVKLAKLLPEEARARALEYRRRVRELEEALGKA